MHFEDTKNVLNVNDMTATLSVGKIININVMDGMWAGPLARLILPAAQGRVNSQTLMFICLLAYTLLLTTCQTG